MSMRSWRSDLHIVYLYVLYIVRGRNEELEEANAAYGQHYFPTLFMANTIYDQHYLRCGNENEEIKVESRPTLFMANAAYGQHCLWPTLPKVRHENEEIKVESTFPADVGYSCLQVMLGIHCRSLIIVANVVIIIVTMLLQSAH